MQETSGLEEESRHPEGAALSADMARHLWRQVAKRTVTQKSFGPRLVISWLLREALASGGPVEYAELSRRTERFWQVVVVRPDGYLVAALSGRPLQRMGQVEWVDGEFNVGRPVIWHVAEAEFANFLRMIFKKEKLDNITVSHTPPAR